MIDPKTISQHISINQNSETIQQYKEELHYENIPVIFPGDSKSYLFQVSTPIIPPNMQNNIISGICVKLKFDYLSFSYIFVSISDPNHGYFVSHPPLYSIGTPYHSNPMNHPIFHPSLITFPTNFFAKYISSIFSNSTAVIHSTMLYSVNVPVQGIQSQNMVQNLRPPLQYPPPNFRPPIQYQKIPYQNIARNISAPNIGIQNVNPNISYQNVLAPQVRKSFSKPPKTTYKRKTTIQKKDLFSSTSSDDSSDTSYPSHRKKIHHRPEEKEEIIRVSIPPPNLGTVNTPHSIDTRLIPRSISDSKTFPFNNLNLNANSSSLENSEDDVKISKIRDLIESFELTDNLPEQKQKLSKYNYKLKHRVLEIWESRIQRTSDCEYDHPAEAYLAAANDPHPKLTDEESELYHHYKTEQTVTYIPNFWPPRKWDKPELILSEEDSHLLK